MLTISKGVREREGRKKEIKKEERLKGPNKGRPLFSPAPLIKQRLIKNYSTETGCQNKQIKTVRHRETDIIPKWEKAARYGVVNSMRRDFLIIFLKLHNTSTNNLMGHHMRSTRENSQRSLKSQRARISNAPVCLCSTHQSLFAKTTAP